MGGVAPKEERRRMDVMNVQYVHIFTSSVEFSKVNVFSIVPLSRALLGYGRRTIILGC